MAFDFRPLCVSFALVLYLVGSTMAKRRRDRQGRNSGEGTTSSCCNFSDDVIFEILSRLPVKSLVRFRCVCKPWLTLSSNPRFITMHLNRTTLNPNNEALIVQSRDGRTANHIFSLLRIKNPNFITNLVHPFPIPFQLDVVGSINGLVCLSNPSHAPIIILWNPATRQYKYLPHPSINLVDDDNDKVSVGFCFDPVRNDYKIIRVVHPKSQLNAGLQAEVYSVNADSWREIEVDLPFHLFENTCAVMVKGVPYWMACCIDNSGISWVCVSFDAQGEVFRLMPLPNLPVFYKNLVRLVNFKDSLACLVHSPVFLHHALEGATAGIRTFVNLNGIGTWINFEELKKYVDVWVMDDDCGGGSSWSKKITFGPILGVELVKLVGCSKNGEIIVENTEGVVFLYDPETKEINNVQTDGAQADSFQIFNYTESLVAIMGSKLVGK